MKLKKMKRESETGCFWANNKNTPSDRRTINQTEHPAFNLLIVLSLVCNSLHFIFKD